MSYRVHIANEAGEGIPGVVYFYDSNGIETGSIQIPASGGDIPPEVVSSTSAFHIDAPGYIGYDVLHLNGLNNFVLVKEGEGKSKIPLILLILLGLAVAGKILKL